MRTLFFLLQKEFLQILRNPGTVVIIIPAMVIQLLIMPFAANYEMKNINLSIVDHDHSGTSQKLINKIIASKYFILTDYSPDYAKALESIENNKADLIIEIPKDFEKDLVKNQKTDIFLSVNAINGTKGGLASSYTYTIINDFNSDFIENLVQLSRFNLMPHIEIISQNWFNPYLNYRLYLIPGILVLLLTLISVVLTSSNIVREKELGTMEQINVSPIKKKHFIFSKIIPFWIIGIVILAFGLILIRIVYKIIPLGNYSTIFAFAAIYLIAMLGFGLVVSTYSNTQQQSLFISFFFMLIFILLCGLFTPITSMPVWAQDISIINPLRYFVEVMRDVVLKGSHFTDLLPQFYAVIIFSIVFNGWAILNYKKRI